MATFGKKGTGPAALQWPRQESPRAFIQPDTQQDIPGSSAPEPTAEEEERYRFWRKVSVVCGCFYLVVILGFGLAMSVAPFFWLSKWSGSTLLQFVGFVVMGLCFIALFMNIVAMAICGFHRQRHPVGMQAYMHRNPKVYAVGTVIGLASFLLLSEHSVNDLIAHFNVYDVLGFATSDREATRPWADFMWHMLAGLLGIGALFYGLDKLHGGESR